jgi:ribosomal protein S2
LFVPDIDENVMIIREALKKRVAIVALVNTDSPFCVDIPIFGNNKDFKIILQIILFLIKISKHKQKAINLPVNITFRNKK